MLERLAEITVVCGEGCLFEPGEVVTRVSAEALSATTTISQSDSIQKFGLLVYLLLSL